ncbi:polysaccharide biosynthesis tyrosine autokinase [Oscillospiraceae bacterium CM]|nr:polysaccharide biosynthesis tyrosine autokinase [Oscillospiraceae bacterium CM]
MQQSVEVTVSDILFFLKRRFALIIVLTLSVGVLSFAASKFILSPTYESTATLFVSQAEENKSVVGSAVKFGDTFAFILKNQPLLENAIAALHLNMSVKSLENRVHISEIGSTEIFTLSVRDSDEKRAAAIIDAILTLAPEEISKTLKVDSAQIVILSKGTVYVGPNILNNSFTGLFVGFAASCIVVFVLELLNNKFMTSEDISSKLSCRVIAVVPTYQPAKASSQKITIDENSILPERDWAHLTESYYAMRANLKHAAQQHPAKKIIIASAISGEGRTSVAVNLAISLGRSGKSVLLIDADFRNPGLGVLFSPSYHNGCGLTEVLLKNAPLSDCLVQYGASGITILPSGIAPASPNDLLESDAMQSLLETLSNNYDHIILDTPPMAVFSDTLSLLPAVDSVLFVVRQNATPFEAAEFSMNSIKAQDAHVLGCVLNGFDSGKTNKLYAYMKH